MYEVIKFFTDLQDSGHPYNVGDAYPREGISVSEKRIAELSGSKNKQGVPLIKKIEEKPAEPVGDTEPESAPAPKQKKTSKSK